MADDYNPRANDHPPALPPKRRIKMIRTQIKVDAVCTHCRQKPGKLACSRCFSVNFCSAECQKKMWKKHKFWCNKVKQQVEETEALIEEMLSSHGGEEGFLQSEKVKKGLIDWVLLSKLQTHVPRNIEEEYVMKRQMLMDTYVIIGKESLSKTAFRLAEENGLDLLCLTYHNARGEECHKSFASNMVAGAMNQEALNYIVYLHKRRYCLTKERLPYLDIESEDADFDDGKAIYSAIFTDPEDPSGQRDPSYQLYSRYHFMMILALLRIKRYQRRCLEMATSKVKWESFLMGTHPVIGKDSPIQLLRGNSLVLAKIKGLVLPDYAKLRPRATDELEKELGRIDKHFQFVHKENERLIPGLLNPSSLPNSFQRLGGGWLDDEEDEDDILAMMKLEYMETTEKRNHAFYANGTYGAAYKMSPVYHTMLGSFLKTGKISGADEPVEHPVGGLYQTAIDVDPTKAFGDCSEFSLICLKSNTSVHTCA